MPLPSSGACRATAAIAPIGRCPSTPRLRRCALGEAAMLPVIPACEGAASTSPVATRHAAQRSAWVTREAASASHAAMRSHPQHAGRGTHQPGRGPPTAASGMRLGDAGSGILLYAGAIVIHQSCGACRGKRHPPVREAAHRLREAASARVMREAASPNMREASSFLSSRACRGTAAIAPPGRCPSTPRCGAALWVKAAMLPSVIPSLSRDRRNRELGSCPSTPRCGAALWVRAAMRSSCHPEAVPGTAAIANSVAALRLRAAALRSG